MVSANGDGIPEIAPATSSSASCWREMRFPLAWGWKVDRPTGLPNRCQFSSAEVCSTPRAILTLRVLHQQCFRSRHSVEPMTQNGSRISSTRPQLNSVTSMKQPYLAYRRHFQRVTVVGKLRGQVQTAEIGPVQRYQCFRSFPVSSPAAPISPKFRDNLRARTGKLLPSMPVD